MPVTVLFWTDIRIRERRGTAGQAHVVAGELPVERASGDRGCDSAVVELVGRREAACDRLRGDLGVRAAHGLERVVASVVASERKASAGHGLAGADVLRVELRAAAGQADCVAVDGADERAAADRDRTADTSTALHGPQRPATARQRKTSVCPAPDPVPRETRARPSQASGTNLCHARCRAGAGAVAPCVPSAGRSHQEAGRVRNRRTNSTGSIGALEPRRPAA